MTDTSQSYSAVKATVVFYTNHYLSIYYDIDLLTRIGVIHKGVPIHIYRYGLATDRRSRLAAGRHGYITNTHRHSIHEQKSRCASYFVGTVTCRWYRSETVRARAVDVNTL